MKKLLAIISMIILISSGCKVTYTMKDISIPPNVKTARINYFENKARIVNPRLSQALTDKFRQKVQSQTRLTLTNNEDAHYDISGYISDYSLSTAGVSNQQSTTNRLNVSFHLIFKNRLDESKNIETDVNTNIDFDARFSLSDVESSRFEDILKNLSDAIFNKVFSNW